MIYLHVCCGKNHGEVNKNFTRERDFLRFRDGNENEFDSNADFRQFFAIFGSVAFVARGFGSGRVGRRIR